MKQSHRYSIYCHFEYYQNGANIVIVLGLLWKLSDQVE